MAISSEVEFEDVLDEEDEESAEVETMQTFRIDFDRGLITSEMIDEAEAIKQFVFVTLRTQRFLFPVYSQDYGSEIREVIQDKDMTEELRMSEIQRMVEEALIYDERIEAVENYEYRIEDDNYYASFDVVTVDEVIRMEEVYLDG